jgi:nicotinate-nucleotide--dimethylbenzimidazole phosphoribosyltransferase
MTRLAALLADLPGPDVASRDAVAARAATVLRPTGALARLDEVAAWLAAWQRTERPAVERPHAIVFAADHGVAAAGVSAYPAEVTVAMLDALEKGAATSAAMARALGVVLDVVDVGVARPTGDLRIEPAMDADRFDEAVGSGIEAVERAAAAGADLLVFGEMGIGNTTAAAAVAATLYDEPAAAWCGRGTGLDDAGLARKVEAVEACRARVRAGTADPIEILREAGGAELAAIAGATVAARRRSIPVVLDGYVVTAAVAPLASVREDALDHVIAGHRSAEPGHGRLLERLGLAPLLTLELRLGEGTGALAAVPLVRLAAVGVVDVATFQEWGLA